MAKNYTEDLDPAFIEKFDDPTIPESVIRAEISQIALNNEALSRLKEEDEDLKEKKDAAREAGAIYRDGAKQNKLQIRYLRDTLKSRGKDAGEPNSPKGNEIIVNSMAD
jgi:hypothetical protein